MNIDKFHNELAMRLGYERIVNDKRILISVVESDDPLVKLKIHGCEVISFKASCGLDEPFMEDVSEFRKEIKEIVEGINQAYTLTINSQY